MRSSDTRAAADRALHHPKAAEVPVPALSKVREAFAGPGRDTDDPFAGRKDLE